MILLLLIVIFSSSLAREMLVPLLRGICMGTVVAYSRVSLFVFFRGPVSRPSSRELLFHWDIKNKQKILKPSKASSLMLGGAEPSLESSLSLPLCLSCTTVPRYELTLCCIWSHQQQGEGAGRLLQAWADTASSEPGWRLASVLEAQSVTCMSLLLDHKAFHASSPWAQSWGVNYVWLLHFLPCLW